MEREVVGECNVRSNGCDVRHHSDNDTISPPHYSVGDVNDWLVKASKDALASDCW